MRIFVTILFLLICATSNAQISFLQPLEKGLEGNKLFGNHEHYLVCRQGIHIDSVMPSIGKVYQQTDSSFKFKLPFPVSNGKMKFKVFYSKGSKTLSETLVYEFVPKTRYSITVTNLVGKKPSPSQLKSDSIKFNFFYDNKPISCRLKCYVIVWVPKRGGMPAPIHCCNGLDTDAGLDCLTNILAKKGDRVFFESPVIIYLGKEIETNASFQLKY